MRSFLIASAMMLLTVSLLSSCNQTNRLANASAAQQQKQIIKDIIVQAEENERKAAILPAQPKECGERTKISIDTEETYAKLSTRLFVALKTANDIKIACYNFNENIRNNRLKLQDKD